MSKAKGKQVKLDTSSFGGALSVLDTDAQKAFGTIDVLLGRIFIATVGSGKNFAELLTALIAYEASPAIHAVFVVFGLIPEGGAFATVTKSYTVLGGDDTAELQFDSHGLFHNGTSGQTAVSIYRNIKLTRPDALGGEIQWNTDRMHGEFYDCELRGFSSSFLKAANASGKVSLRFFRCGFWINAASGNIIQNTGAELNLQLYGCFEIAGTAAGNLVLTTLAAGILNVTLSAGSVFPSLILDSLVGSTRTVNFSRDATSEMAESQLTHTINNILRVAGDQLRLSDGTLLDVAAIADG